MEKLKAGTMDWRNSYAKTSPFNLKKKSVQRGLIYNYCRTLIIHLTVFRYRKYFHIIARLSWKQP